MAQTDVRTVSGGAIVTTGLTLTARFGTAGVGDFIVPQGVSRIVKVTIAATSLGAVDGVAAARLSGNGLGQGGDQWIVGPALGVTAAGPLVGGPGSMEIDTDIPVKPGNTIQPDAYTSTNITGDFVIGVTYA